MQVKQLQKALHEQNALLSFLGPGEFKQNINLHTVDIRSYDDDGIMITFYYISGNYCACFFSNAASS